jgi:hypothetical protein
MSKLQDRMFLAQTTLEAWLESGKVEFTGTVVTLKDQNRTYDLVPAVRVTAVLGGKSSSGLIGRVLPEHQIQDAGGELLEDSVVFGDTAYQVVPGYVATLAQPAKAAGSPRARTRIFLAELLEGIAPGQIDEWP